MPNLYTVGYHHSNGNDADDTGDLTEIVIPVIKIIKSQH